MKTKVNRVKCFHCEKAFPVHAVANHEFKCAISRQHPCQICDRHFASPQGVKVHQGLTHSADERKAKFMCNFPGCEFGAVDSNRLRQHLDRHVNGMKARPRSRSRSRSRSRPPPPIHQDEDENSSDEDGEEDQNRRQQVTTQHISRLRDHRQQIRQQEREELAQAHQPQNASDEFGNSDHNYCLDNGHNHHRRSTSRIRSTSRDGHNGSFAGEEEEMMELAEAPPLEPVESPLEFGRNDEQQEEEEEEMEEEEIEGNGLDSDQEKEDSPPPNNQGFGGEEEMVAQQGQGQNAKGNETEEEPKEKKIDWVSRIPAEPLSELRQQIVEIGLRQKISCYGKLDEKDYEKLLHLNPDRALNLLRQIDLYWDNIVKKIEDAYEAIKEIMEKAGYKLSTHMTDRIKEYVQKFGANNYLDNLLDDNDDGNGNEAAGPSTSSAMGRK